MTGDEYAFARHGLNRGAMKIMLYMTDSTLHLLSTSLMLQVSFLFPARLLVLVALVHLAHIRAVAVEDNATNSLLTRNIGSAVVDTDVDIAGVGGDWGLTGRLPLGLAWSFRCRALAVC